MPTIPPKESKTPATQTIRDKSLTGVIYSKTGIRIGLDSVANDNEARMLIAVLLALVAKSDGGNSLDESLRMVELLHMRLQLKSGQALNLITPAPDGLATHANIDEILVSADDSLSLAQREDLMLMVLSVISADNRKDAEEMKLLAARIEGLEIPDKMMNNIYERYFDD